MIKGESDLNKSEEILKHFGLEERTIAFCNRIEEQISSEFKSVDEIAELNQFKVVQAMQLCKVSDTHFATSTGYGYNDAGREVVEEVYSKVFGAEDALVRSQIISGTHALSISLYGVLRPGDELISVTGKPYDTLEEVIGIRGEQNGSLKEFGINYKQVDLLESGDIDYDSIKSKISSKTKLVMIQRSKGYDWRPTLSVDEIGKIVDFVKKINPCIITMVDNCYGEFVDILEPSDQKADIVVGSLIKNPGGGIATIGGYIVGKKDLIELISYRLTSPGLGKEVGASLGMNKFFLQGLFLAPQAVANSIKGAIFASAIFQTLGYSVTPTPNEKRHDIIQAIQFGDPELLIAFCQGIQKGAPIDSYVVPEPWDMPGYDYPVIMAAGAFTQGASIELSADAPIKEPYIAYFQGGLTWFHAKLGIMIALQNMIDKDLIQLGEYKKLG